MSSKDPYTQADAQAPSTQEAMIQRLEERGKNPQFLGMIQRYLTHLHCDAPITALDLGCGTGVVTRHLQQTLHPNSTVYGADISQVLIDAATTRSTHHPISWHTIPAGPLPYPNAHFDAITMHTLLSHVPHPSAILAEAKRVLKPNGVLIVFDADHASTTYGLPDYETMRETDYLLSSAIATHPDICRQLPRLLKHAGFNINLHHSDLISECGKGDYWLSSVRGFAKMLPALHILTPETSDYWIHHMLDSHEQGTFFASGAFYTYVAAPGS